MSENTFCAFSSDSHRALTAVLNAEVNTLSRWCNLYRADAQAFWSAASPEEIVEFCLEQNLDGVMWNKMAERLMSARAVLSETRTCFDPSMRDLRARLETLAEKLDVIRVKVAPSASAIFG